MNSSRISFSKTQAQELLEENYFDTASCNIKSTLIEDGTVRELISLTYQCFNEVVLGTPKVKYRGLPVQANLHTWGFYRDRGYSVCAAGSAFLYAYGHVWNREESVSPGMEVINNLRYKTLSHEIISALLPENMETGIPNCPNELEFLSLLEILSKSRAC